jgi:hypothetical protein
MTRQRVPILALVVVLLASGCTTADRGGPATSGTTAPAPPDGPATSPTTPATMPVDPVTQAAPTSAGQTASDYRVTYGWAVPSRPVQITHQVRVPVVPPPGPPLPLLVEVRAGDHPAEGYTRITFAFRGGPPSYQLAYLPAVLAEGTGDPVPLPGNAFLRIQFNPAQAHDEQGRPSVTGSAQPSLGYPTLRGYGFAGDFEGYLTYGLGIQVAPGSDQTLPIRALELTRPDGTGVVAVDVRRS